MQPLSKLKAWYERARLVVVYVALALILIVLYFGAFLGPLKNVLLPAALTLVAAFVVQSLQGIEKGLSVQDSTTYADMAQATSALGDLVAGDRDLTDLKVIAATGGTTISQVLPHLLKRSSARRVRLDLQVIDQQGPLCAALPGHWCAEVATTVERLRQYRADPRLQVRVSSYTHLPAFHGMLINDTHLLIGFFGWDMTAAGPELTGAQRPHRLYRRGEPGATQLFEAFEEWFRHVPQQELLSLPEPVG